MLAPKYLLTIGSESFDSADSDCVERIHINVSLDVPADCATIVLRQSDQGYNFARGDEVKISLGYDEDAVTKVFTGNVNSIHSNASRLKVGVLSPMSLLVNYYANKIYDSQNCGKIVSDLINAAGLKSGTISSGIDLPTFVVDDNSSVYDHLRRLADRCGFDIYIDPDGKLNFQKFAKGSGVTAEYGVNVIAIEDETVQPIANSVTILGESPSSTKGSNTVHWLTKQAVNGSSGSGTGVVFADPVIRDKSSASNVAKSRLAILQRGPYFALEMIGQPDASLAGTVVVKGMPDETLNGDCEIRSIEHVFAQTDGFRSFVHCVKV